MCQQHICGNVRIASRQQINKRYGKAKYYILLFCYSESNTRCWDFMHTTGRPQLNIRMSSKDTQHCALTEAAPCQLWPPHKDRRASALCPPSWGTILAKPWPGDCIPSIPRSLQASLESKEGYLPPVVVPRTQWGCVRQGARSIRPTLQSQRQTSLLYQQPYWGFFLKCSGV